MLLPTWVNSLGCLIFLVQLRSLMWIRPSTPSSISTNTPKLVKLRTRAVWRLADGILLFDVLPGVVLELLDAEAHLAVLTVEGEDDCLYLVADLHEVLSGAEVLAPRPSPCRG